MLYYSTLAMLQGGSSAILSDRYSDFVGECLRMTMPKGRLDLLVMTSPRSLAEAERTVRILYHVSRVQARKTERTDVNVTVLLDGLDIEPFRPQSWEVIIAAKQEPALPKVLASLVPDSSDIQNLPVVLTNSAGHSREETTRQDGKALVESAEVDSRAWDHNVVAVGGTFDHLHEGHKLLLTISGYIARECLIIGVTGPELLKNKKYAQAMQSYTARKQSVEAFLGYVYPSLQLSIEMINDVYGPTATIKDIDALVVSKETSSGGGQVNEFRKEKGWPELTVYEVDLIGGHDSDEKISSTQLRKLELDARATKKPAL